MSSGRYWASRSRAAKADQSTERVLDAGVDGVGSRVGGEPMEEPRIVRFKRKLALSRACPNELSAFLIPYAGVGPVDLGEHKQLAQLDTLDLNMSPLLDMMVRLEAHCSISIV
jgi:hypothetical protein